MESTYVSALTIEDYWEKLKKALTQNSEYFNEITEREYLDLPNSERDSSDNHYNGKRLGHDTEVVDITFYKYLNNRKIAFHSYIIEKSGKIEDRFYELIPKKN